MDEGEGAGAGGLRGSPAAPTDAACPAAALTAEEIAVVRALQRPLALVEAPFAAPAREAGMTESALLDRARGLRERGVMRRFAALLDHRRAGFGANVMAVWAVPAARVAEAGARVAALAAVTHCYERPVFGDWPWALFGMIHGRTRQACLEAVGAIRRAIEPEGEALLWTVREFKKTRLTLFTPAYDAWEAAALAEARR